jgi:hypothetical protein
MRREKRGLTAEDYKSENLEMSNGVRSSLLTILMYRQLLKLRLRLNRKCE